MYSVYTCMNLLRSLNVNTSPDVYICTPGTHPSHTYPDVISVNILSIHVLFSVDSTHEIIEQHKAIGCIPTHLLDLNVLQGRSTVVLSCAYIYHVLQSLHRFVEKKGTPNYVE